MHNDWADGSTAQARSSTVSRIGAVRRANYWVRAVWVLASVSMSVLTSLQCMQGTRCSSIYEGALMGRCGTLVASNSVLRPMLFFRTSIFIILPKGPWPKMTSWAWWGRLRPTRHRAPEWNRRDWWEPQIFHRFPPTQWFQRVFFHRQTWEVGLYSII